MPLEDPIIEAMKPKTKPAFLDTPIPENIEPIIALLRVRAQPYYDGESDADYWEITTEDGKHYIRVQQAFLGTDEAEWTKLIGMLLDYAESQRKGA